MKKLMIFFLIASIPLFAQEKNKTMTEEEFVDIYVELSLAAEKYLADQDSVAHAAKMDSIFADAGFTKKDWEEYRKTKNSDPEGWQKIYDKIIARITELQKKEEKDEQK